MNGDQDDGKIRERRKRRGKGGNTSRDVGTQQSPKKGSSMLIRLHFLVIFILHQGEESDGGDSLP